MPTQGAKVCANLKLSTYTLACLAHTRSTAIVHQLSTSPSLVKRIFISGQCATSLPNNSSTLPTLLLPSNNPESSTTLRRLLRSISLPNRGPSRSRSGTLLRNLTPSRTTQGTRRLHRRTSINQALVGQTFAAQVLFGKMPRVHGERYCMHGFGDHVWLWREAEETGHELFGCEVCQHVFELR